MLRTTDKGKIEVLRLAQDDRCLDVILNEVKDLAPMAVKNQLRGPSPPGMLRDRLAQDDRCLDVILNEVIAEHPEHSEGRISPLRQSRTKPEILRA